MIMFSNIWHILLTCLSPFKQFKQLKSLDLSFALSISYNQNPNSNEFSEYLIRPLTAFEGMTRLSLSFYGYSTEIIEKIVINLVIKLRRLRFLDIKSQFYQTKKWTATVLNQLSHFEKVRLNLSWNCPQNNIEHLLIESCKNIKYIEIIS